MSKIVFCCDRILRYEGSGIFLQGINTGDTIYPNASIILGPIVGMFYEVLVLKIIDDNLKLVQTLEKNQVGGIFLEFVDLSMQQYMHSMDSWLSNYIQNSAYSYQKYFLLSQDSAKSKCLKFDMHCVARNIGDTCFRTGAEVFVNIGNSSVIATITKVQPDNKVSFEFKSPQVINLFDEHTRRNLTISDAADSQFQGSCFILKIFPIDENKRKCEICNNEDSESSKLQRTF